MIPERPKSLAEKEADARKNSVLLRYAYHTTPAGGTMLAEQYRHVSPELLVIFEELVEAAAKYKRITGRHLPILGELGELFAEIMFGLKRHGPRAQGSDGQLGNELVEVKTITPEKSTDTVQVKRAGGFAKLIVVKITNDFQFGARMVHRRILKRGKGAFDEISWDDMVAGAPDQESHRGFPFAKPSPKRKSDEGDDNRAISNYLTQIHQDWESSRSQFPLNPYPGNQRPIPFFGNPRTALVATVGVNPSSGEFQPSRNWHAVKSLRDWKERLRDYFNYPTTPAHKWFEPWRAGLPALSVAYETGTAAHFDVSYRATKAMLKNKKTDPTEFRRMVERDAAWFFKLLPLCPNLRLLLTFGPIVRADGTCEELLDFLRITAPRHGFKVLRDREFLVFEHRTNHRRFFASDVSKPRGHDVQSTVLNNLHANRQQLLELISQ